MKSFEIFALIIVLLGAQGCTAIAASAEKAGPGPETTVGKASQTQPGLGGGSYVAGEVIVRFVDAADRREITGVVASINGVIVRDVSKKRNTYLIKIPSHMSVAEAIAALGIKKEVIYAEPNLIHKVREEE